ncbi:sporulation integral membrane protein YtvI [Fictibacillus nanhaiensis]|uniref:sporulation integral membrane protein YtvI n=1 Tax=Fictibacillus nanhaiensis TaxID=742169 RepID=UPI00203EE2F5|nr:sporulation integral membrane protein YtvI [Fictibacillus nanhaiensis]MCM3731000.1 sporulation integral membrane protein YtvI [Fictibacillus nanhaiensis]
MQPELTQRIIRLSYIIFIAAALILTGYYVSGILYPFIAGAVIALIINPLVGILEQRFKMNRALAVIISIFALLGFLILILTLLIQEMMTGFAYIAHELPSYIQELVFYFEHYFKTNILPLYHDLLSIYSKLGTDQQETVMDNIEKIGTGITTNVTGITQAIINSVSLMIVSLPTFLTVFIFSLLAAFFISKDWYRLTGFLTAIFPEKLTYTVKTVYIELRKALFGFLKAQLTLISITACIVLIGLLILRIDYAVTISVLIGAIDLLPYLGTGAVFLPWIAYCFLTGNYTLTIGLSILYGVVVIQRQIMEPKLLSQTIGLDPLATLAALFAGFQLFGFVGLIIGPVFLVVIRALYEAKFFHEIYQFITKPVK